MAKGYVCGIDFVNDFEAMRYWSFTSSWDTQKRKYELNKMLYSGNYLGSEKKDGYFERIIKDEDGNIFMCSRNKGVNGVIEKAAWVPHLYDFFNDLPNGTVLLGEVFLPDKTSKSIVSVLGCLVDKAIARQQNDEDKLRLWVFDILAYNNKPLWKEPITTRVNYLDYEAFGFSNFERMYPYVQIAEYWHTPDDIYENWMRVLEEGGEGIVLVEKNYPYEFGKRTARKTLKVKKELEETIDVFLTGNWKAATYYYTGKDLATWSYWYDLTTEEKIQGPYQERVDLGDALDAVTRLWFLNMAGAVEIALMKEGEIVPIGWISGITDDIRKGIVENSAKYKGKVAEVQAMEIDRSSSIPTLRHGRIIRWREDKNYKECTWEQIQ